MILFQGIYLREMKTYVLPKIYTGMFIVYLPLIAQNWKQNKCPSIGEWINKLWHIVEYYSIIKRDKLVINMDESQKQYAKWIKKTQKTTYCMIPFKRQPAAAAAKSLQSCSTLCDPIDSSPPGSSVSGVLQARILERVAISFSNVCMPAKLLQSYPTLCNPIDSSPPGSSVHGIL